MRWIALVLAVASSFALTVGCGDDDHSATIAPATNDSPFLALEERETAHHRTAREATSLDALRGETARYAADMDGLIDSMMAMCEQMGDDRMGMMGDMDEMHDMMERMSDSVHAHHDRMDTLSTLESMRAECEEHHETMIRMMDDEDDMRGGMGGAMGHGMGR